MCYAPSHPISVFFRTSSCTRPNTQPISRPTILSLAASAQHVALAVGDDTRRTTQPDITKALRRILRARPLEPLCLAPAHARRLGHVRR